MPAERPHRMHRKSESVSLDLSAPTTSPKPRCDSTFAVTLALDDNFRILEQRGNSVEILCEIRCVEESKEIFGVGIVYSGTTGWHPLCLSIICVCMQCMHDVCLQLHMYRSMHARRARVACSQESRGPLPKCHGPDAMTTRSSTRATSSARTS